MTVRKKNKVVAPKVSRENRLTISFSDEEFEAVCAYARRYKAKSRTAVVREAALRFIMGRFVDDYPTLFEKNDLDRLIETEE